MSGAASHTIEGGPFLRTLPVRVVASESLREGTFRLGRCSRSGCGTAFAWRRGGAKLGEMRCLVCGSRLTATRLRRERQFVIAPYEISLIVATDSLQRARALAYEQLYSQGEDALVRAVIGRLSRRLATMQQPLARRQLAA